MQLRSAALYKEQVKKVRLKKLANKTVTHFEGIKGKCWFAKYCSLTEALVIGWMMNVISQNVVSALMEMTIFTQKTKI